MRIVDFTGVFHVDTEAVGIAGIAANGRFLANVKYQVSGKSGHLVFDVSALIGYPFGRRIRSSPTT